MSNTKGERTKKKVDQIYNTVVDAVSTWAERNSPENVKNHVHNLLDKKRNEMVWTVLGFDHSWGQMELSNFSTSENAKEITAEKMRPAIEAVLDEVFAEPIQLSKTAIAQMRREYYREYRQHILSNVYEKARQKAEDDLDKLIDEHVGSDILDVIRGLDQA